MGVTLSGSQGLSSPQANGYVGDVMIPPKKFMKVAAFGVHAVNFLMLLQRLSPAIIRFLIQEVWSWFQDVAVQSSGIVTTSRYVVPTGRVKVPAGRYVVPTGKDNVIVSAGRSKVIPAGRTILVLEVIILISLASLRLEDLSRAGPTSCFKGRLHLLHMDLCGHIRIESINGKKYILVIVDDYSRYTWTHFLRTKDETPEVLKDFLKMTQRNFQAQVITVRTDRGTEFLNKTL
ncbi:retrovirus-related pol polyprotein from transposon TNT 1-94 [Tanacetum coccineum]